VSRLQRLAAVWALPLLGLLTLPSAGAREAPVFAFDLGVRTEHFEFPPLVARSGVNYVALDVLSHLDAFEETPVVVGPVAAAPETAEAEADAPGGQLPGSGGHREAAGADEGEAIVVRGAAGGRDAPGLPREFRLDGRKYVLRLEQGSVRLVDDQGRIVGSPAIVDAGRFYLAADTLFELGMALAYSPDTANLRLLGTLREAYYERLKGSLYISTLLPATGFAEAVAGGFRVVLDAVFVKENQEQELPVGGRTKLSIRNLPHHRLELRCMQEQLTGFKLYGGPAPATSFRVHFGNHFDLVSYERTSSGEIALRVAFTRPAEVTPQLLHSPNRLVLDFANTTYDEATRYIDVNIGGVRQIRVGQFAQEPPVVRVVVEMTRVLRYRILRQGDGECYYIQLYTGERSRAAIMLDAGHGGSDTGAIGVSGVYEKDLVLAVTRQVAQALRNRGYEVLLTRESDRFLSLGARADLCNRLLPMVFVSIHANSIEDPAFTGVMSFHFAGAGEAANLAHAIQRNLVSAAGAVDRGVRTANFFVLRETVVPAVLVEIGFLTNAVEESNLRDAFYQRRIVDGLTQGIDDYMRVFGGF